MTWPPPPKPKLVLDPGRRRVRQLVLALILGSAVLASVAYWLPAHCFAGGTCHANYADTGPIVLAIFIFVALFTSLMLRGRSFGSLMAAGGFALTGTSLAAFLMVFTHIMTDYRAAWGERLFGLGLAGMFFGGIAALALDPALFIGQARANRRRARPAELPIAVLRKS